MTPAERSITHAMQLVEEMPDDMDLAVAMSLLGNARARIAAFAQRQRRGRDTEPSPPPSFREPLETLSEGAE